MNVELLSPAKSIDVFKACIDAGADAIYFGGNMFGARAYATNFTYEEAEEAIRYAHLHNSKAFLTVNTLLKNLEIEKNLYDYLKTYTSIGIDAFIVQDMGVFSMVRDCFPSVDIHASTQMTVCNPYGAAYLSSKGAARVVTARELSLNEINDIHKANPDLEIESFIHGALCMCYSGQCLMSSIIGGRSGNRGRCAQPCRLPYKSDLKLKGEYILSPKDFCLAKSLKLMADAGVYSFKIEGRMKSLEYAAGVTAIYREIIDRDFNVSEDDITKLLNLGNRSGFTDLYLTKHNGPEMISFGAPSHTKDNDDYITPSPKKIPINAKLTARIGSKLECTITCNDKSYSVKGGVVEASSKIAATEQSVKDSFDKLGNTAFVLHDFDIELDDNVFLPVSAIKNIRRDVIELLVSDITSKSIIINEPKRIPKANNKPIASPGLIVSVETREQYDIAIKYDFIESIAVPLNYDWELDSTKNTYIFWPVITRKIDINIDLNSSEYAGVIATSFDCLGYLNSINYPKNKIILDHRLYTFNNMAIEEYNADEYIRTTCPYELSLKELNHRDNSNSDLIIHSYIPLMVTANCQIKNSSGCNKNCSTYKITDRNKETITGKCYCGYCYNVLYNCKQYSAFSLKNEILNLGIKNFRIDFSIEDASLTDKILNDYKRVFIDNKPYQEDAQVTHGHLKRGVE